MSSYPQTVTQLQRRAIAVLQTLEIPVMNRTAPAEDAHLHKDWPDRGISVGYNPEDNMSAVLLMFFGADRRLNEFLSVDRVHRELDEVRNVIAMWTTILPTWTVTRGNEYPALRWSTESIESIETRISLIRQSPDVRAYVQADGPDPEEAEPTTAETLALHDLIIAREVRAMDVRMLAMEKRFKHDPFVEQVHLMLRNYADSKEGVE